MKFKATLFFLLISKTLFGQVLLVKLNEKEDIKNKKAAEIVEELKMGSFVINYLKKVNTDNQLLLDERHNTDGEFIARFTYTYDSINSLKTSATKEYVDKTGDHYFNVEKYEYNSNDNLVKVVYLDNSNNIYKTVYVKNDSTGNPEKLDEYGSRQTLEAITTINYQYKKNRAYYSKVDINGTEINSGFFVIDYDLEQNMAQEGFEYNEHGDLIKTPDGYNEILYDSYGNWISIKRFNDINGSSKLSQEQTRVIKYRN